MQVKDKISLVVKPFWVDNSTLKAISTFSEFFETESQKLITNWINLLLSTILFSFDLSILFYKSEATAF